MQHGRPRAGIPSAIRVVSTPVPAGRLYRDLTVQLRAMYDDLLSEPLPERLMATAGLCDNGAVSLCTREMSDGAATIASGVDR
jgi:hypothetical protein